MAKTSCSLSKYESVANSFWTMKWLFVIVFVDAWSSYKVSCTLHHVTTGKVILQNAESRMQCSLAVCFNNFVERTLLYCTSPFPTNKSYRNKIRVKLTAAHLQPIWCSSVFSKVLTSWAWAICVYILNTPNLGSPIGAFKAELKLSPRTVRVSTGSMTPSSHNLQEQQKEWAVFYCQYWGQLFFFNNKLINMETFY